MAIRRSTGWSTWYFTTQIALRPQRQAAQVRRELDRRAFSKGLTDVDVSGPAPGVPERVRGRYRWRLLLRGQDLHEVLEGMDLPAGCTVDVDPVHLL